MKACEKMRNWSSTFLLVGRMPAAAALPCITVPETETSRDGGEVSYSQSRIQVRVRSSAVLTRNGVALEGLNLMFA